MNWEENQHDRNKINLECGAVLSFTVVKPPQLGKTKFAGTASLMKKLDFR